MGVRMTKSDNGNQSKVFCCDRFEQCKYDNTIHMMLNFGGGQPNKLAYYIEGCIEEDPFFKAEINNCPFCGNKIVWVER